MKLCYRLVPYDRQSTSSTSSSPGRFLKYRGFCYYSKSLDDPQKPSLKKMTYRGVSYYQYGSELLTIR